ncbi:MAG: DUF202 domain-containing protein [Acidobacteria bacterium]|nr:DUF202 domain-containing protein [Acidobacteriota bacterium]
MTDTPHPARQDATTYLAVERTFLAWIRTGLALMGIGFAVSRFGLFLRQLAATDTHFHVRSTGLSLWSGVALVTLGVLVNLLATIRHIRTVRELRTATWIPGRVSMEAILLAVLLAIIGIAMGVYLMAVR